MSNTLLFFSVSWKSEVKKGGRKNFNQLYAKTNIAECDGFVLHFYCYCCSFFLVFYVLFFLLAFWFCVNAIIFIDRSQVNQMLKETARLNKHKNFIYD